MPTRSSSWWFPAVASFTVAAACSPVEIATVDWMRPEGGCRIGPADGGMSPGCYQGEAVVNTLVVQVLLREDERHPCSECVGSKTCPAVQTQCRCGPDGTVDEAVGALQGIEFEELDLDHTYCVRVLQLGIRENERPQWGACTNPGFRCSPELITNDEHFDTFVRGFARSCSISGLVQFSGRTPIEKHGCRETNPRSLETCLGAERSLCR
jgi:hypothetical protein